MTLSVSLDQNDWISEVIHPDLIAIKDLVYNPCGFRCTQLASETESTNYGACLFKLNDLSIRFRVAKITPTKVGQFVTLWKRTGNGPIQPYDLSDPIDFFVISLRRENYFGHFVFPKLILYEQGILSERGRGGKRAMRIYPPWDKTTNKQAQKTQAWQLEYFLSIPQNNPIDCARCQSLYGTV